MAEVQTSTNSGQMTQRFVEFVMMHAQNAALFLGQIPHPQSGKAETNLELAKMFIDQLVMIQEKTRGNLSQEETTVLRNAISNLQLAYVEAARADGSSTAASPAAAPEEAAPSKPTDVAPPAEPSPTVESESRKKFTKSYGA